MAAFAFHATGLILETVVQKCSVPLRPAALLKKETLAQVLSCEFCKISKNTFSYRTPPVTAPVLGQSQPISSEADTLNASISFII